MKVQVIVDGRGNIIGALAKGARSEDAEELAIRPAEKGHRLTEVDVPEEVMRLSADEFHKHLKSRLGKTSA